MLVGCNLTFLRNTCEKAELESASAGRDHPYAREHMLTLVLQQDLTEAKFLWYRLSDANRTRSGLVWNVVRALLGDEHVQFYRHAAQLASAVKGGALENLVEEMTLRHRTQMRTVVQRAYDVVSVESLREMLGMQSASQLRDYCDKYGWTIDGGFISVAASGTKQGESRQQRQYNVDQEHNNEHTELQRVTEQLVKMQTSH